MSALIDMAGNRYSGVLAIRLTGRVSSGDAKWEFLCDCGNHFEASGYSVRSGKVKTCPTCSARRTSAASIKHMMSGSPEFATWTGMLTRCYNKSSKSYECYGGRGIKVCDEWKESFLDFYNDIGPKPGPEYSIDRIDADGDYEPMNCRWATNVEQANNKRNNRIVELNGLKKTVAEWAREKGINQSTIYQRIKYGWSVERAITEGVKW